MATIQRLTGRAKRFVLKKVYQKSKLLWKLNAIGQCGAPRVLYALRLLHRDRED